MSKKYYSIKKIMSLNAQYNLLLGMRSNGKSYQAKELVLKDAYKNDSKFVYLRRYRDDIKNDNVKDYFGDMPIEKYTNGDYNNIIVVNSKIYFAFHDENGNFIRKKLIGRACALKMAEHYKSLVFLDYEYIIYEEFITDDYYLPNEPNRLMQFVSTVARDKTLKVILIGNTISRVCPYVFEWGLENVLNQKMGTIDLYNFHHEDSIIKVAVEYCSKVKNDNGMFFGNAANQIINGEWDTREKPKLPCDIENYKIMYVVKVEYEKFNFSLNLLQSKIDGAVILYVSDSIDETRKIHRFLSNIFTGKANSSYCLEPEKYKGDYHVIDCIRKGRVCYNSNLTGTDFENVIKNYDFTHYC